MVRYLIIILLLSSCGRDLDLNPWTTVLKQIYKVQGKARTNSFYIGRTVYNLNNDAASRFPSSITAMEIKGA